MRSYASSRPPAVADDDSWEVRAFAEDTSSAMGTTWPPRFYNCVFCRREFRSAQALGGHMNVHRRDRARMLLPPDRPTTPCSNLVPTTPAPALGAPSSTFSHQINNYNFAPSDSCYENSSCLLKLGSSRTSSSTKEEDDQVPAVCEEPDLELRLGW